MNLERQIADVFSRIGWHVWRRACGWPLIRVVGDSHVKAFARKAGFVAHRVEPLLPG